MRTLQILLVLLAMTSTCMAQSTLVRQNGDWYVLEAPAPKLNTKPRPEIQIVENVRSAIKEEFLSQFGLPTESDWSFADQPNSHIKTKKPK